MPCFKIAQKVAEHLNYFCKKSFKNSPIWPHCQCRNLQIRNCGHQPDENAVSWQRRAWNLGEDDGDEGVGDVVVDHRQPLARHPFVALNHGRLSNQSFFKMCHPRPLFVYFRLLKSTVNFLQQINMKFFHPLYGAQIQTHNLQDMSLLT